MVRTSERFEPITVRSHSGSLLMRTGALVVRSENVLNIAWASGNKPPIRYILVRTTIEPPLNRTRGNGVLVSDDSLDIPHNLTAMREEKRLSMLKIINLCEHRGKLIDTRLIDYVFSFFSSLDLYVRFASSPLMGKMAPYQNIQLGKLSAKLSSDVNVILVPLCDDLISIDTTSIKRRNLSPMTSNTIPLCVCISDVNAYHSY